MTAHAHFAVDKSAADVYNRVEAKVRASWG